MLISDVWKPFRAQGMTENLMECTCDLFGSSVGLQHMMLKYSQFETRRGISLSLNPRQSGESSCIQNNGIRHWIFLRAFDKVGPAHIVQYVATHFSTSIFQLTGRRWSQFALPSHFLKASCTADCRAQLTPQKSCWFHLQHFSKVYIYFFFCPSIFTTGKKLTPVHVHEILKWMYEYCRLTLI